MQFSISHIKEKISGFTMVEVIVAVAIFSFISLALFTSFSRTFSVSEEIDSQDSLHHAAKLAIIRITQELSDAFLKSEAENPNLLFVSQDDGDFDRIKFNTFLHFRYFKNVKESDQNLLVYYTEDDNEKNGKRLVRREKTIIDDKPDEGGQIFTLLNGLTKFNLKFCSGLKPEWANSWNSKSIENKDQMPIAVKIELGVRDEKENELNLTEVALINSQFNKKTIGQFVIKGCE